MYKLRIYQDEYWEMYDRRYPITIIMPNNVEKENNISKNWLICDIVNKTHKFSFEVFEEHYIYFRKPCMSNAIIPSIFTERVCEFPGLQEEMKKPSSLLTIVLDGYDNFIKKQTNKLQTFLSNCFNKMGHKVQIIIIKCEVFDYPILKSVKNMTQETTSSFTQGMSSSCPVASIIGLKNIIETSKDCKLYWEGKNSPLYMKKLSK